MIPTEEVSMSILGAMYIYNSDICRLNSSVEFHKDFHGVYE